MEIELIQPQTPLQPFDLQIYLEQIKKEIKDTFAKIDKSIMTYDILDTEKSKQNKLVVLREKQKQIKIGYIWQYILGNYHLFVNLGIGHSSGLDIISYEKKIAVEIKNRTNTDNYSSKKSNFDKLAKYKKEHPEFTCIYGNINAETETLTKRGRVKTIIHNGVEIKQYIGMEFIRYLLGEDTDTIISFVKNVLYEHNL